MRLFFLVAILSFIAMSAYAGWDDDHNGVGVGCEEIQPNPGMQRRCWYNFTDADGVHVTPMLEIRQCENYSVAFTPDFDGVDTTARVQFYVCLDDTDTQACFILENVTLDGVSSANTETVYGADGTWGYASITVAPAADANARIEFRCNQ